jgi:hypothetical protein
MSGLKKVIFATRAADYVKELDYYGFQISMSRKGNPYDIRRSEQACCSVGRRTS